MEGMDGGKVQEYFNDKKYSEIARYCAADVKATAELYSAWESYIRS
jgi:predicted PolB exonuclease-like 3'-5' exonuclease